MNVSSNVENRTNVSSLIASSISKLNLNSVKKPGLNLSSDNVSTKKAQEEIPEEESIVLPDAKPEKIVDVDDIQKYAQMVGENVSVDDINYGIMYGRSVIADYIA